MKNVLITLSASLLLMTISCKKKEEKKVVEAPTVEANTYQVTAQNSKVKWTGYKFTEKKGVSGVFKTINVLNAPKATSALEAFNGVDFTIPVSSVFSENEIRDTKLKTLFFGMMDNTELLSGSFITEAGKVFLNLKMNNETQKIPLQHTIVDRNVSLKGSLNIMNFKAVKAYNSIHKACELLHTGTDGISKTWEDVAIDALVVLK